jgi:PAS domain S-box-containing protein
MPRKTAARALDVDDQNVLHETPSLAAGPALDAVLHWVGDGVWIELEGVNRVNPTGRHLLGLGPDDDPNLGQGVTKIATLDGRALETEATPAAQARALERAVPYRVRITRRDGVERVIEGTAAPIVEGGKVRGMVTTFRDVTDEHNRRLLTERLLEQLFEALPTAVVVAHPESGEVLSANRAFGELVGHAPEELLGAMAPYPWEAEVPELDFTADDGDDDALVREGYFRRNDGRLVAVEIMPLVIREDSGSAVADVRLISDLSERRRFEHQIVQSGKLAAIGELAAGVAHEINNPLFAILGLVEFLLKDAEPGTKQHDRLELIQRTGLEIKDVVRALLDFAGERSDEFEQVSLNEVLSQTLDLVRRTSLRKDIELIEQYPSAPLYVQASTGQLKQVFLNLITNAQQAMPESGSITIGLEREGKSALVHVTDTGSGIEDDVIDRIFDPFFTTKRELGGTGLGLALSQSIAVAHGGSLAGLSLPSGGAEFTLRLPLAGEWR